jgi:uncharacterized protein
MVNDRVGEWMQTARGQQFWPLDPRPEEVFVEDIAHHLANQCRYAGACKDFYSVAQHSVIVSKNVPEKDALWGLLHDASEAYLTDMIRPIKNYSALGQEYKKIEAKVMVAICDRFGLSYEEPESVAIVDKYRIIGAEKRDVMGVSPAEWKESGYEPLSEMIFSLSPANSHFTFLDRFYELTGETKSMGEVWSIVRKTRLL